MNRPPSVLHRVFAVVAFCVPLSAWLWSSPSAPPPAREPMPADTGALSAETPESISITIFLIALEDGGASGPLVGCGDSAVPVHVQVPGTPGRLRAAFEYLLSLRVPYHGESGLYNALYENTLTVDSAEIVDGNAVVRLSGELGLRGVCDNPRVEAQLRMTAMVVPGVVSVKIYVNGAPLQELLSGQGQR